MTRGKFPDLEGRKYTRFKDKVFIFGSLKSSPIEEIKAIAENISAGGLMFEIEREIRERSELELEIYQPMDRDKRVIFSIPALAMVKWSQKIEKNDFEQGENKYRVGIEFLEIEEGGRKIIAGYVEKGRSEK